MTNSAQFLRKKMADTDGPTIILVGGEMVLDSGERLDSRQPIARDKWDFALRSALSSSERWWDVARSLAEVILKEDAQQSPSAWALVWAPKNLRHQKPDGSIRRVRIRSVLPNAVSLMDVWSSDRGGSARIDASRTTARYRVLEPPLRYADLSAARPPAIFVGAHPTEWDVYGNLAPFADVLTRWPSIPMVLPHTPLIEATVVQLQRWFASGRSRRDFPSEEAYGLAEDYVESKAAFKDHNPTVVGAQFQITFFLDQGKRASAADLYAALELVLSRYDLKIGLWDLARDSGLRESLLTPKQLQAAPPSAAQMPEAVRASAAKSQRVRANRQQAEAGKRRSLHASLWPLLEQRGWFTWDSEAVGEKYIFRAGGDVTWSDAFPPSPILFYELAVSKHQSVLRLRTAPFGFTAMPKYLGEQSAVLRGVTGQYPEDGVLCRFQGCGWENASGDSQRMIPTVDAIVDALEPSIPALRSLAESEFAIFQSKYPLSQVGDGQPVTEMTLQTPKLGFWKRLFGR
jgi:hypothetical protein